MEKSRVMIYVQHLLGVGHQRRAAAIARALVDAGLDVAYVSGGSPVSNLDVGGAAFEQLPPCKAADSSFRLVDAETGDAIDEAWKGRRRASLLDAFARFRPAVIVIEMYPFGRRAFRFELEPLLEAAASCAPRPRVVSSVRDVLVEKRDRRKLEETVATIQRWFDLVLVHGDADFIPFDATFPLAPKIASRMYYTGYVCPEAPAERAGDFHRGEILVSAGGGRVGERLLAMALDARALSRHRDVTWRLLVGRGMTEDRFNALAARAGDGVVVERARADFVALLAECGASVSLAGYNTVTDVLTTGAPAVLVPFADRDETEQATRAARLAERGLATVVDETTLEPGELARAVDAAVALGRRGIPDIRLDGARETARIVSRLARGRRMKDNPLGWSSELR
ncbi:MAG: glycosyltransferase [Rhodospirillales bacterium]|jgi:predicted glycosyltransferase|nr:glycosyltransferase [Rhodospirillales bacterium]MDP6806049.1 glycosyltransferase [Rhodospirillales bacterium]